MRHLVGRESRIILSWIQQSRKPVILYKGSFHGLLMPLKPRRGSFSLRALFTQRKCFKKSNSLKPETLRSSIDTFKLPNCHFHRSKENYKAISLAPSPQTISAVGKIFPTLYFENLSSHRKFKII